MIYANRYLQVEAALATTACRCWRCAWPSAPASPSTGSGWRPPGWCPVPGCRNSSGSFPAAHWGRHRSAAGGQGAVRRGDRRRRTLPGDGPAASRPASATSPTSVLRRKTGARPAGCFPGSPCWSASAPSSPPKGKRPGPAGICVAATSTSCSTSCDPGTSCRCTSPRANWGARPALRRAAAPGRDHRAAPPRPRGPRPLLPGSPAPGRIPMKRWPILLLLILLAHPACAWRCRQTGDCFPGGAALATPAEPAARAYLGLQTRRDFHPQPGRRGGGAGGDPQRPLPPLPAPDRALQQALPPAAGRPRDPGQRPHVGVAVGNSARRSTISSPSTGFASRSCPIPGSACTAPPAAAAPPSRSTCARTRRAARGWSPAPSSARISPSTTSSPTSRRWRTWPRPISPTWPGARRRRGGGGPGPPATGA